MKAKTILFLYNRDYTFIEQPTSKNNRYADNLSKCISIEDKFEKLVYKETFDLITKAFEYQNEMSSVEMKEAFIESFSSAVSLLLESLSKK